VPPTSFPILAGSVGVAAALLAALPGANRPLFVAAGAVAVAAEASLHLRGRRPGPGAGVRRVAWLAAGAALAVGVAAYVLGVDGGILCSPGSWLQPHAVWHVAQAVAVALYVRAVAWGDDGVGERRAVAPPALSSRR
jgi:hypothetical protein